MLILVLIIMGCSLVGTVLLIGFCTPLSNAVSPIAEPRDNTHSIVIEEPLQDDGHVNANRETNVPHKSKREDVIKANLREGIARSSVPILRARGMTDEEIKAEILRDFSLTEEQVDEILAA